MRIYDFIINFFKLKEIIKNEGNRQDMFQMLQEGRGKGFVELGEEGGEVRGGSRVLGVQ